MSNNKTSFICGECGFTSAKWYGRCPECGTWNSFTEQVSTVPIHSSKGKPSKQPSGTGQEPVSLKDLPGSDIPREITGISELDRVLGGGIVEGSFILLGGEPGIGRSTLLLQLSAHLSRNGKRILYISGEESRNQIKLEFLCRFKEQLVLPALDEHWRKARKHFLCGLQRRNKRIVVL